MRVIVKHSSVSTMMAVALARLASSFLGRIPRLRFTLGTLAYDFCLRGWLFFRPFFIPISIVRQPGAGPKPTPGEKQKRKPESIAVLPIEEGCVSVPVHHQLRSPNAPGSAASFLGVRPLVMCAAFSRRTCLQSPYGESGKNSCT